MTLGKDALSLLGLLPGLELAITALQNERARILNMLSTSIAAPEVRVFREDAEAMFETIDADGSRESIDVDTTQHGAGPDSPADKLAKEIKAYNAHVDADVARKKRKLAAWTPERRAAQSERLRKKFAAKKLAQKRAAKKASRGK